MTVNERIINEWQVALGLTEEQAVRMRLICEAYEVNMAEFAKPFAFEHVVTNSCKQTVIKFGISLPTAKRWRQKARKNGF